MYKCKLCGSRFASTGGLERHREVCCKDKQQPTPVVCRWCGEEAPTRGSVAGLVHRWGPRGHRFTPRKNP